MTLRLLAIAVTHSRIGYVFHSGGHLADWHISERATKSAEKAAAWVQRLIDDLRPDVVVTEKPELAKKKGAKTKVLIEVIARVAANNEVLDVSVARSQEFANKYEEAAALAVQYPELRAWVPQKRRFFDNEPRTTVLFEALALARMILDGPQPETVAVSA